MDQLLYMDKITKVYPNGVLANNKVSFSVVPGEIHALVGENGAGKTTLMKILFGLEHPEEGKIYYKGEEIRITSPLMAINRGIGMVHQHFMLAPSLTVVENMLLGMEPKKGLSFDWKKAISMTEELAKTYNLPVYPKAKIQNIPIGMCQKVEILKALLRGAELLVLDEPTAVLTPQETKELFLALKGLKEKGHTIIFISHKLREVKEISDRVTVMRGGELVGVSKTKEVSEGDISRMMVGRDVVIKIQKTLSQPKGVVLEIKNLTYRSHGKEVLRDINFTVKEGEILGIAGVEGNGQRELIESITGLRLAQEGHIYVEGTDVMGFSPKGIRNLKAAHIPEDRMTHGVAALATIQENLIADRYEKRDFNGRILTNSKGITQWAKGLIKEFKIRTQSPKTLVKMLSGGNIQKVAVARELSSDPRLVIANQPTRGVDVGAIEFIHQELLKTCRQGAGVLLVSADLNELINLSDRLLVIFNGQLVALFQDPQEVTEEELGQYMLGIKRQDLSGLRGA